MAVCLWGRSLEGTRDVIVIDRQVVENDGRTAGERMNYAGDSGDFDAGKCTVNINSVTEKDAGLWSCNLVTRNSTVFSGAVHLGESIFIKCTQWPKADFTVCHNFYLLL